MGIYFLFQFKIVDIVKDLRSQRQGMIQTKVRDRKTTFFQ